MLDIPTLTSVDHDSSYYNEEGKAGIFYAQSWALIHMLNFAPEYRPGLANFIQLIWQARIPGVRFNRRSAKVPAVVLQDLKVYVRNIRFEGLRFRARQIRCR